MYKRILVPVDGSSTSLRGLSEAVDLARSTGAVLRLVHVVDELVIDTGYEPSWYSPELVEAMREGGQKILDNVAARVPRDGIVCETILEETVGGRASDRILAQAKQWPADLIVMGTHGRRGLNRLAMGSDAELVLRSTPVPVMIVRDRPDPA
jgi:nucleotide-binding universal stress UspA family protein